MNTHSKAAPALAVLLSLSAPVAAIGMMEPYRQELLVRFDNKDRLRVSCAANSDTCRVRLLVNGRKFEFSAQELGGAMPTPEWGRLYSGAASGRDAYFSFDVSVQCPEEQKTGPFYECHANGLVEDGKLTSVKIVRTREESVAAPRK